MNKKKSVFNTFLTPKEHQLLLAIVKLVDNVCPQITGNTRLGMIVVLYETMHVVTKL